MVQDYPDSRDGLPGLRILALHPTARPKLEASLPKRGKPIVQSAANSIASETCRLDCQCFLVREDPADGAARNPRFLEAVFSRKRHAFNGVHLVTDPSPPSPRSVCEQSSGRSPPPRAGSDP